MGEDLLDDENPTIYIRGLPWKATAEEVQEFFAECGAIKSVDLPLMGDGRSSGTAIVEFESPEGSAKAMECNGADFGGRWLNSKFVCCVCVLSILCSIRLTSTRLSSFHSQILLVQTHHRSS